MYAEMNFANLGGVQGSTVGRDDCSVMFNLAKTVIAKAKFSPD